LFFLVNTNRQLAHPNTQIKFSRDIEKREKERKEREKEREEREKVRERNKIWATKTEVITERATSMDQDPPQRGLTKAMPFLPDPPSFDLTVAPNQWHGGQSVPSEVTRQGGAGGLNVLSSACDLVPYL
jgi:hypothetical protein